MKEEEEEEEEEKQTERPGTGVPLKLASSDLFPSFFYISFICNVLPICLLMYLPPAADLATSLTHSASSHSPSRL